MKRCIMQIITGKINLQVLLSSHKCFLYGALHQFTIHLNNFPKATIVKRIEQSFTSFGQYLLN